MTIRPATLADRDGVLRMATHFIQDSQTYAPWLTVNPDQLDGLFDFVLAHGAGYVAEDRGGDVVGMIGVAAVVHGMTGVAYAEEIVWWVEPSHRSGLVGPKLLRAAEAWTVERQLPLLKMVAPAGTDVGAFYERLGYTAIETVYGKAL